MFSVPSEREAAAKPATPTASQRLRPLDRAQALEAHKLELVERADRDPDVQARRARDREQAWSELARAAERWSSTSSTSSTRSSSSPSGSAAVFLALDPDGYQERQAIQELSAVEANDVLARRIAELEPSELRELPELASNLASIRYGSRLRRMGLDPSDPSLSDNRKLCNPPPEEWRGVGRGGAWWLSHRIDAKAGRELVEGKAAEWVVVDQPCSPSELPELEALAVARAMQDRCLCNAPSTVTLELEAAPLELGGELVEPGIGLPELVWRCAELRPRLGSWEPTEPSSRAPGWWKQRRQAFRLARGLMRIQADRQCNCRRYPLGDRVGLHQHRERAADGQISVRLSWAGNETCGSVWACPECSRLIRTRRAQELGQLEGWAGKRARLVTLTIAHGMGDDLRVLREGMARAWQRLVRGEPWVRFSKRTGLLGYVKALEVKHGRHGWHPHFHAIVVGDVDWPDVTMGKWTAAEWLAMRWQAAVVAELGSKHCPSLENGCDVSPMHDSKYLVKMGLELVLDWTKVDDQSDGAERRIPWQIAADWIRFGDVRDRELWIGYARAIKGARQLTWSRKLRELAGIGPEQSDEQIAKDAGQEVGSIDRADWSWLVHSTGELGYPLAVHALELGEAKGLEAMAAWIADKRKQIDPRGIVLRIGKRERVNQPWKRNDEAHALQTDRAKWRSKRARSAGETTRQVSGTRSSS